MKTSTHEIVIWDRFVRLFHWSVATLFLLDFWVLEAGDPPHNWSGYAIGFLLLGRILWGFTGNHNARFSSFFPTPARVRQHLLDMRNGTVDRCEGHNPLGGAMVLFLMLMLVLVILSGWLLTWDMFWGEGWLEDLHELFATVVMAAVVIHVSAVFVMGMLTGIPLLRTMITGKRPA